MDLKLHRPQTTCATTGRPFAPGEVFYSALVRDGGSVARVDVASEAWQGPPERSIAWWRSRYPQAGVAGPTLAPPDVLLDALESLEEAADESLRYLLALQLVRRRVLRIVDEPAEADAEADGGTLTLACRKRDREYRVRPVAAAEVAADGVEARLAALLWSGDAA
jgi:hypothetical protein